MAAYGQINRLKPSLMDVTASIEEFALDADWSVEITFADALHEPDRAGGSKEISLD